MEQKRQRGAGSKSAFACSSPSGFDVDPLHRVLSVWHRDKGLRPVVHGDDFTSSGTENELRWQVQEFEKYITKVRGIVGPESHDLRSMTILNRILELKSGRITFEADPRHVDMIINGMRLVNCKGSDVVGRSLAARCNFFEYGSA